MSLAPVTLNVDGDVAVLTLNRPDTGNAIDLPMAQALADAAVACDRDRAIRSVLLRASGRFFCVGGSIDMFAEAGDAASSRLLELANLLHAAVSAFARMDKPLVTAVQGGAAGAGFSLAVLGDIALAGRSANLSLAYTAIGLTPDGGASWLLPRLTGLRRAQELLLLNPRLSADDARNAGLLTEVVEDDALDRRAMDLAHRLARGPTLAFARARALLLDSYANTLETHLAQEARAIADSAGSADGRAGVAAFISKQRASFEGR